MNQYSSQVLDALAIEKPIEAIAAVKDVIAEELAKFDRRARILRTDYFNHSYTPDFVLEWSNGDGPRTQRNVYLRFQSNRASLLEDLERLGDQAPILFGLGDLPKSPNRMEEVIRQTAATSESLVTDTDGVEGVLDARETSTFVRAVSATFGRGAQGLLDESAASRIVDSLDAGFAGARALDPEKAISAAAVIGEVLAESYAAPFLGFLRAVWVGNGGDPSSLPFMQATTTTVPDEALQFLLELDEISDQDFWWQIGAQLSLEQLGRLRLEGLAKNLQHLMRAAHPFLTAKLCAVLADQPRLEDGLPALYWVIERGLLALRGRDFSAYLAARQEALAVQTEQRPGLSLQTLRERADTNRIPVGQFELAREDRNLSYGSDTSPDVIHDSEINLLAEALGPTALVERAEARLPDGKALQLDFKSLIASGRTAAQFPLREIVLPSLALLWSMDPADRTVLEHLLPMVARDTEQLPLDLRDSSTPEE